MDVLAALSFLREYLHPFLRVSRLPLLALALALVLALAPAGALHIPSIVSQSGISKPAALKLHEGIPAYCHAENHTDYGSPIAFVWGATFITTDAAECCEACRRHNEVCMAGSHGKRFFNPSVRGEGICHDHKDEKGANVRCNAWVFCGEEQCFSFDVHKHLRGECWLKYVKDPLNPSPWQGGKVPEQMRRAPRAQWPWAVSPKVWAGEMPERVSWTAGVLAPKGAAVTHLPAHHFDWYTTFCRKHGCS